ncbi:NADH-ubiquinone oxidoreductase chain K [hydrothermal vent metagenome]|uniref:NADH-ubiquinone oxidoreductase chain K n=1 Tax=hydrothermal vent metagenome TaxID=652676 RepID=A0A3B1CKB0_9ZZZZ
MESALAANQFLALSAILFVIGVAGVLTRRNVIVVMMSIELMLNAGNLVFITFSHYLNDMSGHVFVFMVMAVAAAEAAVGLAIALAMFKNRETVDVDEVNLMKG